MFCDPRLPVQNLTREAGSNVKTNIGPWFHSNIIKGPITYNFKINFKIKINFESIKALEFQLDLEIKSGTIFLVTK